MRLQDIEYKWYRFKCWIFGHKHTCCPDIHLRCSHCNEPCAWEAERR